MAEQSERIKSIIRDQYPYLKQHYGIKRIGLFGSFAAGAPTQHSDIDLLVEFTRPIGFKFMALADYLEEKLDRKVDLLTPDGINSIRIKHVADNIKNSISYV